MAVAATKLTIIIAGKTLLLGGLLFPGQSHGVNIVPNAYGRSFLTPDNQLKIPLGATNCTIPKHAWYVESENGYHLYSMVLVSLLLQ